MLIDEPFLKHPNDFFGNRHLKTSMKEEEDFIIVSDDVWKYLYEIYGGADLPRMSIQVAKDDDDKADPDYMVEVYLKRIFIYILPRVKNHLFLKKPSSLFISRTATVQDLRVHVAEILKENKKEMSVKQLMNLARIWRLDIGETVMDLEKFFEHEIRGDYDSLPL